MIRRIEALNYRCLRYVNQPLGRFHVLVGANASGKSTFLDVLGFLRTMIRDGLEAAIEERTQNFFDLTWGRKGKRFELAVEVEIPENHRPLSESVCDIARYEVAIGVKEAESRILNERVLAGTREQLMRFSPDGRAGAPRTLRFFRGSDPRQFDDNGLGVGHYTAIRPDPQRSFLSAMRGSGTPVLDWLADLLSETLRIELETRALKEASPPGKGRSLLPNGANLPRAITRLKTRSKRRYAEWLAHLRTALIGLEGIRVKVRGDDQHRYLMVQYPGGLDIPSWMLSDGTLRLLALTILAYLPDAAAIRMIEEPENSLHPLNIETVMQSLQSVYDGQVLVASHSPLVLSLVKPEDILVFSRDDQRGTTITPGNEHPGLEHWQGEVSLGTLFAGGVLG